VNVLIGEMRYRGSAAARWTSEVPGRTGPYGFYADHWRDAIPKRNADAMRYGWVYWMEPL